MNKLYRFALCLTWSIDIFTTGTRPNTPELEIELSNIQLHQNFTPINPAPIQSQGMQRNNTPENVERLSYCEILRQTAQSYRTDYNEYGICHCFCMHQDDTITNSQVRNCRKCTEMSSNLIICPFMIAAVIPYYCVMCCYECGEDNNEDD